MTAEELEKFCRLKAGMGWSQTMVIEFTAISRWSFRKMAKGFGPINWPRNGRSIRNQESHEERRGRMTDGLKRSVAAAMASRLVEPTTYKIGEHTGTPFDLYKVWGKYCSTSLEGVKRRLGRGWPLLDAFFAPSGTGNPNTIHKRRLGYAAI